MKKLILVTMFLVTALATSNSFASTRSGSLTRLSDESIDDVVICESTRGGTRIL